MYYLCGDIKECLKKIYMNKYEYLSIEEFTNVFNCLEQNKEISIFKNLKKQKIVEIIKNYYYSSLNKPDIFKKIDSSIINHNTLLEKYYLHTTFPNFSKKK